LRHPILGLHHATATVDDAQADLDFYLDVLGLRLVKKTVNFDNHNVYHFYYGDERGTPGTIWTTFPYRGWRVPPGQPGRGQITATSFSIPSGSLSFWKTRLQDRGARVTDVEPRFGEDTIAFADPSGLTIQLVASEHDDRNPWSDGGIEPQNAIRGLHSVTMNVEAPAATVALMTTLLGFDIVNQTESRIRLAVNGDEPGKTIELVHGTGAPPARNGLGTVHHVAMAISSSEEQLRLRQELLARGYGVTEVLDRQYFRSIYFREPGGVLFEVATVQPGFAVDEPLSRLGRALQLPPWEEPHRAVIEEGLPPVNYR
jgi:glyoxalase family protein